MRSARPFLPFIISLTTKRSVVRESVGAYFSLRAIEMRRGMALYLLGLLGAVQRATLLTVAHAGGIERAADDVVLDRRQVAHPPSPHEHDAVLLEVVADARDVGGEFLLVGETHARDLAKGRVRLLGRHRAHLEADATLLRGAWDRLRTLAEAVPVLAHGRRLDLLEGTLAALAHELADRRHER